MNREIKIENVIIEFEKPLKFFKFEDGKTYEVEIDLQRILTILSFKKKNGEEYKACVYNIRILKENGKEINSE